MATATRRLFCNRVIMVFVSLALMETTAAVFERVAPTTEVLALQTPFFAV